MIGQAESYFFFNGIFDEFGKMDITAGVGVSADTWIYQVPLHIYVFLI